MAEEDAKNGYFLAGAGLKNRGWRLRGRWRRRARIGGYGLISPSHSLGASALICHLRLHPPSDLPWPPGTTGSIPVQASPELTLSGDERRWCQRSSAICSTQTDVARRRTSSPSAPRSNSTSVRASPTGTATSSGGRPDEGLRSDRLSLRASPRQPEVVLAGLRRRRQARSSTGTDPEGLAAALSAVLGGDGGSRADQAPKPSQGLVAQTQPSQIPHTGPSYRALGSFGSRGLSVEEAKDPPKRAPRR